MAERTIVDTGPIVAVVVASDAHHSWAREAFGQLAPPLYTCEAVLSESQFLIRRFGGDPRVVLEMVRRGSLKIEFNVADHLERLIKLQRSYHDVPMSLADACLVRMSELDRGSRVFTTDSDFGLYRRNDRQLIPLLAPA